MEPEHDEHYKISNDKLEAISRVAGLDRLRVRAICTYPWPDSTVHQQWLDEASVEEIAHWASFVAEQEDADRGGRQA